MSFLKNLFGGKPSLPTKPLEQPGPAQTRLGVRARYFYKEYYDKAIAESAAFNDVTRKQYEQLIAERGPTYEGYKIIEFQLADGLLIQLAAAYSRGDSVQSLLPLYEKAVYHFIRSWDNEDFIYNQLLRIISLGWLMNSTTSLAQIADLFIVNQFDECIIKYMLAPDTYKVDNSQQLMFPDDEGLTTLWTIIQSDQDEAVRKMKLYLDNYWYTPDNLDTNYDSHKNSRGIHIGYWSFEAGAISKIMKLNDSTYKDHDYYPYELVHWQQNL